MAPIHLVGTIPLSLLEWLIYDGDGIFKCNVIPLISSPVLGEALNLMGTICSTDKIGEGQWFKSFAVENLTLFARMVFS